MPSLKVYKPEEYKVIKQSNPRKEIKVAEYNMLIEPVTDLKDLDILLKSLRREKIDYIVAQVDTVVKGRFGDRYKRAYSIFTEAGEIKHTKVYYNNLNKEA